MEGMFKIDGINSFSQWKISIREGSYGQIICIPPIKDVYTNDWYETDGIEADLSSPVSKNVNFTLSLFCSGSISDIDSFLEHLTTPFIDGEGTDHGVYHSFEFPELGDYSVNARFSGLDEVSLGDLRPPLLFNISLYNDVGVKYDDSIVIPDPVDGNSSLCSIDDIPFSSFGIVLTEGTIDGIRGDYAIKDGLVTDLPDEKGVSYDVHSIQKTRGNNLILKCHMKSSSITSLMSSYISLGNLLFKPGYRSISVPSLGRVYKCYYSRCSIARFYPIDAWLDFDLTFKVLGQL